MEYVTIPKVTYDNLMLTGGQMSNCCYNLCQPAAKLSDNARKSMGELHQEWDAYTNVAYKERKITKRRSTVK